VNYNHYEKYQTMNYQIKAHSSSDNIASISIKQTEIKFGVTTESEDVLSNPAEIFLGALSACILKNVERFSTFMNYEYSNAEITIGATRMEKPPRMDEIHYELKIYTKDSDLNINLLKKNIEKFGTIYNTVKSSCTITGEIKIVTE